MKEDFIVYENNEGIDARNEMFTTIIKIIPSQQWDRNVKEVVLQ